MLRDFSRYWFLSCWSDVDTKKIKNKSILFPVGWSRKTEISKLFELNFITKYQFANSLISDIKHIWNPDKFLSTIVESILSISTDPLTQNLHKGNHMLNTYDLRFIPRLDISLLNPFRFQLRDIYVLKVQKQ